MWLNLPTVWGKLSHITVCSGIWDIFVTFSSSTSLSHNIFLVIAVEEKSADVMYVSLTDFHNHTGCTTLVFCHDKIFNINGS